jgi:hypothetical protein
MPIPHAENAKEEEAKARDNLLNIAHPDGGSKAVWFQSIGYKKEEWKTLAKDLVAIAKECHHFETEETTFGTKYRAEGRVGCPGHHPGKVLTVWIAEEEPPRLVTAYPQE